VRERDGCDGIWPVWVDNAVPEPEWVGTRKWFTVALTSRQPWKLQLKQALGIPNNKTQGPVLVWVVVSPLSSGHHLQCPLLKGEWTPLSSRKLSSRKLHGSGQPYHICSNVWWAALRVLPFPNPQYDVRNGDGLLQMLPYKLCGAQCNTTSLTLTQLPPLQWGWPPCSLGAEKAGGLRERVAEEVDRNQHNTVLALEQNDEQRRQITKAWLLCSSDDGNAITRWCNDEVWCITRCDAMTRCDAITRCDA